MATKSFEKALLGLMMAAAATPALAGGLERGGYNIDLLFDKSDYALESTATFAAPQRKVKNAVDNPAVGGPLAGTGWATTADDAENYWVPRLGAKAAIGDNADCMFDYSQPWGADLAPGQWQGSSYNIETKVKSENRDEGEVGKLCGDLPREVRCRSG